jgi:hypothetical protein
METHKDIRKMRTEIAKDSLLKTFLVTLSTAFIFLFWISKSFIPLFLLIIITLVLIVSIIFDINWAIGVVRYYRTQTPRTVAVRFQVGEAGEDYRMRSHPTPCYAFLGEGREVLKVKVHPIIFKSDILHSHDGIAKVYFNPKSRRPSVIETNKGLVWVFRSFL